MHDNLITMKQVIANCLFTVIILSAVLSGCKKNPNPSKDIITILKEESFDSFEDYKSGMVKQPFLFGDTEKEKQEALDKLSETLSSYQNGWALLKCISFKYPSVNPDGEKIELSGRIYMRYDQWVRGSVGGIILANHYTITADSNAPSNSNMFEGLFALKGYAVVMSDYYGFGATKEYPQAYLHETSTAQACVDAFLAAKGYLENHKVSVGDRNYNIGYSQGGAATIAVQKLVETGGADSQIIKFEKTIAGAGPYDIILTYKRYVKDKELELEAAVPLIVTGMNSSENLNIDYKNLYLEPLLSHWEEWIVSKKYDIDEVCKLMGTYDITKILHKDAMDSTTTQNKLLISAFERNSLTRVWKPTGKNKIILFHSTKDDVVPLENTTALVKLLKESGHEPTLISKDYGGHLMAALYFLDMCDDEIKQVW